MKPDKMLAMGLPLLMAASFAHALDYPSSVPPGRAIATTQPEAVTLQNDVLHLSFSYEAGHIRPERLVNLQTKDTIGDEASDFFRINAGPGRGVYRSSQFDLVGTVQVVTLQADPENRTAGKRFPGIQTKAALLSPDGTFVVNWSLELRDGSNYVRQSVRVEPQSEDVHIASIQFCDMNVKDAHVAGTVPGSPVVAGSWFLAYEHPSADNGVYGSKVLCRLERNAHLRQGQLLTQSAVMGVVPAGQLRRGFLYYLERERVSPYRPFLHYNSWYDIAWGDREKMNSAECVDVIRAFGDELTTRRGVRLDGFVFDDGWDDPKTLWRILGDNFPGGFSPLQQTAESFGSRIGLWLSPWGGYGQAKADRLAYGRSEGFEMDESGFSLAGPRYSERFRDSCVEFVRQYHVNFFKFDGTDAARLAETEALLRLCRELYGVADDMVISLTTGTWASPFWLLYADSTWRGGGDMGFYGPGPRREQWLTYRDKTTYQNVVRGGPLYPLNSFMNQGIAHSVYGTADLPADANQFAHEVHSFFGIGTSLQELYISPGRMTAPMWDTLAEAAKWSRGNCETLVDTHWIGGDPNQLQVYGCASWNDNRAILMLRNPDGRRQTIAIDIGNALDLPPAAHKQYTLASPWRHDAGKPALTLTAGKPHRFELAGFEVIVLQSTASR